MKPSDAELEIKKDIDLGMIIDSTAPLRFSIPVRNASNRLITIQKLSKDCSCMSVKIDKLKLAPGEVATIRVVSNLMGKSSVFTNEIIVESDAIEKVDEIQIRGQITGQVRIRPQMATMVSGDQPAPGCFTVFCDDQDGKWKYTGFESDDPHLAIQLKKRQTTPTTSVYDGSVDFKDEEARRTYAAYHQSSVTLNFVNDRLGKSLKLPYPIEIAVRRRVAVDPPQVTFVAKGDEQKRTVLVQSRDAVTIDAVQCASPAIKTAMQRIDRNSLVISLVFLPTSSLGESPGPLACDLVSGGKTVGSIPINIVDVP
jgi:hypothetical protein